MGFLDFLFDKEKAAERKVGKLKKTLTNMYVQPPERKYAIQQLRDIGSDDAIDALLARFVEQAPNTTVDVDEKEYCYEMLADMSAHPDKNVRSRVENYLHEHDERINWPLKVLTDIVSKEEMTTFITELLADCNTEYTRNPEKKQELVLRAADLESEELSEQVARFAADDNETIRFLAIEALIKQADDELVQKVFKERIREETSIRILKKIAEVFADNKEWIIPEEEREDIDHMLPDEYGVHKKGHVYRTRT
jgi:HEAT repeat protein